MDERIAHALQVALVNGRKELSDALYNHLIELNEKNFDVLNLKWVIQAHYRMEQYEKVFELYEAYHDQFLSKVNWTGDYKSLIKITEYSRFAFPVLASEYKIGKAKYAEEILEYLKKGDEVGDQLSTYRLGLYYDLIGQADKGLSYFQKAISSGDGFGVLGYCSEPQLVDRYKDYTSFYKEDISE